MSRHCDDPNVLFTLAPAAPQDLFELPAVLEAEVLVGAAAGPDEGAEPELVAIADAFKPAKRGGTCLTLTPKASFSAIAESACS